jgi:ACS family tartrate transporter-like MFS transporter
MNPVEQRTISKISWRLLPLLMISYFIAYLDRVNLGFAGAAMSKDLGFTAAVFGSAAGIFFLAYFLFEVPSNMALERFGARRWIARIMFSWGILSAAQAWVGGSTSFNVVRFLLGIAEAGFFPGVIFYITLWFPAAYRARIVGWFMFAIPDLHRHRLAHIGLHPQHGRRGRHARLAVALHPGGDSLADPDLLHPVLPARRPQGCEVAQQRRARLAAATLDGERRNREALTPFHGSRRC